MLILYRAKTYNNNECTEVFEFLVPWSDPSKEFDSALNYCMKMIEKKVQVQEFQLQRLESYPVVQP